MEPARSVIALYDADIDKDHPFNYGLIVRASLIRPHIEAVYLFKPEGQPSMSFTQHNTWLVLVGMYSDLEKHRQKLAEILPDVKLVEIDDHFDQLKKIWMKEGHFRLSIWTVPCLSRKIWKDAWMDAYKVFEKGAFQVHQFYSQDEAWFQIITKHIRSEDSHLVHAFMSILLYYRLVILGKDHIYSQYIKGFWPS